MDVTAAALVIAQWVHTMAAAFWLGGGILYLLVIRPAAARLGPERTMAEEFRGLVDIAVIAMVVTGVVLAFDRLTSQHVGVAYAAVLGAKLALTLWMFWLAGVIRRRRRPRSASAAATVARSGWRRAMDSANQVVIIGVVVFLLSTALQALFEQGLG